MLDSLLYNIFPTDTQMINITFYNLSIDLFDIAMTQDDKTSYRSNGHWFIVWFILF